jgi:DNA topoisomerase-1
MPALPPLPLLAPLPLASPLQPATVVSATSNVQSHPSAFFEVIESTDLPLVRRSQWCLAMRLESNTAVALATHDLSDIEPDPRLDPARSARRAGLRYVDDREQGLTRKRRGRGFSYVTADGKVVRDRATLERIRSLAIPPAWTSVWICADEDGHLQATGRDAKGRKQYRYHAAFRAVREETKFERVFELAKELPRVREFCQRALREKGLSRDKVIAAVLTLLDQTLVRVGNEEYARTNQSFGLTTLRGRHVRVRGSRVELRFVGKSGKACMIAVSDRQLARVVQRCQELPGEQLFEYLDEQGEVRGIGSNDINETLRAVTGQDFTAKDIRTWAGTVLAAQALAEIGACDKATERKRCVVEAIKRVSTRLHNTPAVCRKSYVHPGVLEAYEQGRVLRAVRGTVGASLRPEERAVLALLTAKAPKKRVSSDAKPRHLSLVRALRSSARHSRGARPPATRADRAPGRTRRPRASRARR